MYSEIYWITRLDEIKGLFCAIAFMSSFATLMAFIIGQVEDAMSKAKKFLKWSVPLAIVFVPLAILTPDKEDAILIYAGGKAYEYVQSDTSLQKLPYKTTEYMKVLLEREINEIKKQE